MKKWLIARGTAILDNWLAAAIVPLLALGIWKGLPARLMSFLAMPLPLGAVLLVLLLWAGILPALRLYRRGKQAQSDTERDSPQPSSIPSDEAAQILTQELNEQARKLNEARVTNAANEAYIEMLKRKLTAHGIDIPQQVFPPKPIQGIIPPSR